MIAFLKQHTTTAAVTFATAAVFMIPGAADLLELRPDGVADGEVWRLLSGHLTHCGPKHLLWDLATFVIVAGWLERHMGRRALALSLLVQSLLISLAVLATLPAGIVCYRGLSGIDSGLFVLAAILLTRDFKGPTRLLPGLMLAAFIGKSVYEFATGSTLFVSDGNMQPIPVAHLAGAAVAAGISWMCPGLWKADSGAGLRERPSPDAISAPCPSPRES